MVREFDVVVLGAGPVGENVADRARAAGLEVVIVEHELVGGDCSFWACVPSKTLLRSSSALHAAKRVPGAAEAATGALDAKATLARRNAFVSDWNDGGGVKWLDGAGIELVRGHGRLDGVRRVIVSPAGGGADEVLVARHAVAVCSGTDPVVPDIPGLAGARPWTSREATSAQEVPARLAVIGGGVVAAEMATAYAGLGSEVTVLARSTMLRGMEPFAGEAVTAGLRAMGATVRLGSTAGSVRRNGEGEVEIELAHDGDGRGEVITVDEVLVATGRRPRTDAIGAETAGLEPGSWIEVEETLAVTSAAGTDLEAAPWLYAVGDVTGRVHHTHQGKYEARAAGDVIAARALGRRVDGARYGVHAATADGTAAPEIVFGEPEVAAVGHTAATAAEAGIEVRIADASFSSVSGAGILADGYEGRARLVIDASREVLVGATFVGQGVAELAHQATIAIVGEVPVPRLWHAVPAFPTLSEIWLRLLEADGRPEATA